LEQLRVDGFEARLTSILAPLQIEGRLPSGETFYFRSEWGQAQLGIGGDEPWWKPDWMSWKDWDDPKRGDLPGSAEGEFRVLLDRWRNSERDMREGR
jgi:hypothetical protein